MSTLVMNKKIIQHCFEKSKTQYDQHAIIQENMADQLLFDLQQLPTEKFDKVLEIGCGTGLLTRRLMKHFTIHHYFANDLVSNILDPLLFLKAPQFTFLSGDIETLQDLPTSLDLVVSNAAFQWIENIHALFEKLAPSLRPGGWLSFSTFGPDNLKELASLTGLGLCYPACETIKQMLTPWFDCLASEEKRIHLAFPDALSVIRHLRATGVNSLSNRLWTKNQIQKLISQYEAHFSNEQGVQLTYHPMSFLLQRKKWQPV